MPNSNSVHIVPIDQLSMYRFFIPSYQRGYRWTQDQVTDLLCDIDTFSPRETAKDDARTWYCLQPVVVKLRSQETNEYEVIDGQQRITTLFLIVIISMRCGAENKKILNSNCITSLE